MGTRVGRWLTGELVDLRYWERGMQMDTLSHFFPCWVSSLMTRNTLGLLFLWCLRVLFASPCKPHHLIFISNQYLSISCPLLRQPRFCKENGFLCVYGGVCVCERERERNWCVLVVLTDNWTQRNNTVNLVVVCWKLVTTCLCEFCLENIIGFHKEPQVVQAEGIPAVFIALWACFWAFMMFVEVLSYVRFLYHLRNKALLLLGFSWTTVVKALPPQSHFFPWFGKSIRASTCKRFFFPHKKNGPLATGPEGLSSILCWALNFLW